MTKSKAAPPAPQPGATGDGTVADRAGWSFGGQTPKHFDRHVRRSVPFYEAGHGLVAQISDYFVRHDTVAYEIGSSTGTLVRELARRHPKARWIGVEAEGAMIEQARDPQHQAPANLDYLHADAHDVDFQPSDFIVSYYTVQFIPPKRRQYLIDRIYSSLNWGGAFLLFEKVRAPDARFQDLMSTLYTEFKLESGYTAAEIVSKASSLKGVLEPFSTQGNLDMLQRAGFVDVMTIFKHVCFEGFLAIK